MRPYGVRVPPDWVEELSAQLAEIAAEVLHAEGREHSEARKRLRHRFARLIAAFVPEKRSA